MRPPPNGPPRDLPRPPHAPQNAPGSKPSGLPANAHAKPGAHDPARFAAPPGPKLHSRMLPPNFRIEPERRQSAPLILLAIYRIGAKLYRAIYRGKALFKRLFVEWPTRRKPSRPKWRSIPLGKRKAINHLAME